MIRPKRVAPAVRMITWPETGNTAATRHNVTCGAGSKKTVISTIMISRVRAGLINELWLASKSSRSCNNVTAVLAPVTIRGGHVKNG